MFHKLFITKIVIMNRTIQISESRLREIIFNAINNAVYETDLLPNGIKHSPAKTGWEFPPVDRG